ncbi:hypothetical protein RB593_010210 [Gaeumannomyces tritici]
MHLFPPMMPSATGDPEITMSPAAITAMSYVGSICISPNHRPNKFLREPGSQGNMSQDISTVMRPRVLSNSAAEFVETRAQRALGAELARDQGPGPQYVSELDKFVRREDIVQADYYAESQKKVAALKTRLVDFSKKMHGLDNGYKIAHKAPEQYGMNDVLDIVRRIENKHRTLDKVMSCSGIIRRCFRAAGENSGAIEGLLSFAPNDIYGSVISGGFTLILGALERADKIRSDIYGAVADVPYKIMEVKDLLGVHIRSAELQRRADTVFVAVFDVLFAIVEELSKNLAKKGVSLIIKGSRYGTEIDDAINALEGSLNSFRIQAKICDSQRLGKMDTRVARAALAAESTEDIALENQVKLQGIENDVKSIWEKLNMIEKVGLLTLEESKTRQVARDSVYQVNVYNQLYMLCTGSPIFDDRVGNLNVAQYRRRVEDLEQSDQRRAQRNKETVKKWLVRLDNAHLPTTADQESIIDQFKASVQAEQDKVQYLLMSEQLGTWIKTHESMVLILQNKSGPSLYDAVSFVSAFMYRSLCALYLSSCPVLGFFSGCRAVDDSTSSGTAGPDGMLATLLAQLLDRVEGRDDVDISSLGDPPRVLAGNSTDRVAFLADRLRQLMGVLPKGDSVIIVLDSVWHIAGDEEDQDAALAHVLDLVPWAEETSGVVVKILATNFLSHRPWESHEGDDGRFAYLELPEHVDSGVIVINPENLDACRDFARELELA